MSTSHTGHLPSQGGQGSRGNVREFHLSEKSEKMSGKCQGIPCYLRNVRKCQGKCVLMHVFAKIQ